MSEEVSEEQPLVSVVIPVHDDAGPLKKCLKALDKQGYPDQKYEVIVVDNNSEEDISSVVSLFECGESVHESKQGSYAARNRGIRRAEGDVIAFTDADCIPSSTWIEEGVRQLTGEGPCKLVGGRIDFYFQTTGRPTPVELFDSTHFLDQKKYVFEGKFAATANAFTWKRMFDEIGLFDETLCSGGDTEWGHRLHEHGYEICYTDDARVKHPARHSYRALRKKKLRVLEGTSRARADEGYPIWRLALYAAKDIGHHVKFALRAAAEKEYGWKETVKLLVAFPFQGCCTAWKRIELWSHDHLIR